jgi:hypothetical protein
MRKSLIMGMLAFAATAYISTSCSRDEFSGDVLESKKQAFESVFKSEFGNIDPEQDWGFGSVTRGITRGNTGDTYPATHEYKDADGNVIAGANMNHNEWADPSKQFGGWVVPDALTEGQKLRVQKYFQANPNLSYEDPQFRHFFVQQVYTGGTDAPTTGNKEVTKAANGTEYKGSNLNQMTVGEANSHINNFNAGTCSTSNVLDNGSTVNNGTYHSDQITLMVNVFDTSCFGYHETGGSNVKGVINHNDKMALVSAAVIDTWAAQNGNPGEAVVDKWNRSFMGFDYELLPEEDIIPDNPQYAKFTDVPAYNNIQYAWDGTNVMVIGSAPQATEAEEVDITATFAQVTQVNNATCAYNNGKIVCTFSGQWYSSIAFTQYDDWSSYSKLVIEFDGASPVKGTLHGVNASTDFAVGATSVEVACSGNRPYIAISTGNNDNSMGTLIIKKVSLVKEGSAPDASIKYYDPNGYLLGDDNKIMFYSSSNTNQYGGVIINLSEDEMKTTQEGKTCLNLVKFKELADGGYHPISTDLKKWVKWQPACDGYYSDWIVTLTEAQRIPIEDEISEEEKVEEYLVEEGRVFCEDLGQVSNRDLDYNDVVFDAWIYYNKKYHRTKTISNGVTTYGEWEDQNADSPSRTVIKLLAAGGTLPIQVAGEDVHNKMGNISTGTMINTVTEASITLGDMTPNVNHVENIEPIEFTASTAYPRILDIPIVVKSSNSVYELTAYQGQAPQKFKAPVGTPWPAERCELKNAFPTFENWVSNRSNLPWSNQNATYLYSADD